MLLPVPRVTGLRFSDGVTSHFLQNPFFEG
jgi:hypothetical protein